MAENWSLEESKTHATIGLGRTRELVVKSVHLVKGGESLRLVNLIEYNGSKPVGRAAFPPASIDAVLTAISAAGKACNGYHLNTDPRNDAPHATDPHRASPRTQPSPAGPGVAESEIGFEDLPF